MEGEKDKTQQRNISQDISKFKRSKKQLLNTIQNFLKFWMIIIRIITYVFAYFQEIKTKLKIEGIGYRIF